MSCHTPHVDRGFPGRRHSGEIYQEYPSVGLADVYAVIAFYLGRRDEIDAYLDTVREREAHVVDEIKLRAPLSEIRRWLLARKTQPA